MSKAARNDMSAKIGHLFSKAAGMIGYAMDLDGLVFYDAVATGAQHRSSNLPSMFADDVTSLPAMHGDQTLAVPLSQYRQDDTAAKDLTHQLSQSLIRHLTTAYPQGHVFAVDEYGIFETEAKHSSNEWSELFECVPQARYVMFLPLWHYQRESCYATCLTWVSETGKTLDSNDINSLAAFDNSLMAEIFRLEASTNTQSKSDFVSSISHELRSPLHGILATTELMQENMDDSKMLTMIGMIESCSNTLLDTFDHLLEFSNVNSRTNNSQDAGTRSSDSSAHGQANTIASDLESLVEDVLEAVLLGHTSAMRVESDLMEERQDTPTKEEKPTMPESVIVTTNIAQERNWTIPIEKGAWKRMLLNIFSNALKYTNSGHVDVTLALLDKVDQRPPQISLSVTDTGIGMSHEFLKYQLFTPFTQENSLSPGTGLGLSIVKSIVESLHGKVFVESRLHEGTRVTINIPWDENPSSIGQPHSSSDSGLEGLSIGLFSMSSQGQPGAESTTHIASPTPVLERSIRSICEAKIGMTVSTSDTSEVDILLIDTHALVSPRKVDLETLLPQNVTRTRPQALVLLGVSEASMAQHFDIKKATYLVSPITKKRLCAALASAVEKAKSLNDSTSNSPATENKENTPTLPISTIAETTPSTQISSPPQPPSPKPLPRSLTLPTNPTPSLKPSPTPPQTCRFHHLLLVDDNPINLKLLVAFARRLSLPYTTAADGAEAVRLYQNAALSGDAFDCVFMDISMPVMDGFQAVEEIRKFEKRDGGGGKRCFVFALTGLGSEKARREAGRAGCDEFLLKPVRFRDVGVLLGAEYG
jgi:signal transduction histidine kinase/CheY-like chemotaxis protein